MRPAPRRLGQAVIVCLAGSALAIAAAPGSRAQTAAPITVIPPSIAPATTATLPLPEFPTTGALEAPNGSGGLTLVPSTFVVEGGFAKLAQRIQRPLHVRLGHLVNLHHIRLATIEQALALAADLPGVTFSHDRYRVMRFGIAVSRDHPGVSSMSGSAQLSQGLGDFAAVSQGEALASGAPFTRAGSGTGFTHVNASARGDFVLGRSFDLALTASGQASFGQARFRAELFSLERGDGLSAYVGGITSVDERLVARAQVNGRLAVPTGPEQAHARFSAGNVGLGVSIVPGARLPVVALE